MLFSIIASDRIHAIIEVISWLGLLRFAIKKVVSAKLLRPLIWEHIWLLLVNMFYWWIWILKPMPPWVWASAWEMEIIISIMRSLTIRILRDSYARHHYLDLISCPLLKVWPALQ